MKSSKHKVSHSMTFNVLTNDGYGKRKRKNGESHFAFQFLKWRLKIGKD